MDIGLDDLKNILEQSISVAIEASRQILEIRRSKNFEIIFKGDGSPVTSADIRAHEIISQKLMRITPDILIVSEEGSPIADEIRAHTQDQWLVDPLDGTQDFIHGSRDFTVNLGLWSHKKLILGVVVAPAYGEVYGAAKGLGAFRSFNLSVDQREPLKVRTFSKTDPPQTALVSYSHRGREQEAISNTLPTTRIKHLGSSLKICRVAAGEADFYLRFRPTSEWDTAAGQCILEHAGGFLRDPSGNSLQYGRENIVNPSFVAQGMGDLPYADLFRV